MQTVKLRPAIQGQVVLDPETRAPLPQEGREVVLTPFWRRRLRDGSVVAVGPSARPSRRQRAEPAPPTEEV